MSTLSAKDIAQFNRDGFLMLQDALDDKLLTSLNHRFQQWTEESKRHKKPFGETMDGRPRFDLEPGHSAERPALRRVASPIEIDDDYLRAMRDNRALDALTELIAPNLKFHHCKINAKLPGAATQVKFHQDFLYEPHTNHDLVTVLFFLDEVTEQNGALEVVPGSHTGALHDLWHNGIFTGAVDAKVAAEAARKTVRCTAAAGTACLMHTRLLHASAANLSAHPRTLFIVIYSAEDAMPLSPNPLPSRYAGEIVRGEASGRVRCCDYANGVTGGAEIGVVFRPASETKRRLIVAV